MQDVAECTIVKKVTLGVTIVLLLTNAYITTITAFAAPVLGNMAKAFPNAGAQIGLVMSLPALVMIPAIIIAGYLSSYLSKKTILMIGSIIFLIGGVALVFYDNMTYILITRAVCGFGAGLVFPMTPALIAQLFGRDQVPKMIGWMYTAGSVFSVILGLAAGYLGVVNWHFAFDVVWIFVIMIILQQILLPKVPPEKQDTAMKEEKASLNVFAWAFIVLNFLYMCIQGHGKVRKYIEAA